MAEWTGAKREEMYALLAEGKLAAARDLVAGSGRLKRRDYAPKDKNSIARLGELLKARRDVRDQLAAMVADVREPVHSLATMLCDMLEFPLDAVQEQYQKACEQVEKVLINLAVPEALRQHYSPFPGELVPEVKRTLGRFSSGGELDPKIRHIMIRLLEVLLKRPTPELMLMIGSGQPLTAHYSRINHKVARVIRRAEESVESKQQHSIFLEVIAESGGRSIDEQSAARLRKALNSLDLEALRQLVGEFPEQSISEAGLSEGDMSQFREMMQADPQMQARMLEILYQPFPLGHAIASESLRDVKDHGQVFDFLRSHLKEEWRVWTYRTNPRWRIPKDHAPALDHVLNILLNAMSPELLCEVQTYCRSGYFKFREYLAQEFARRLWEEKGSNGALEYFSAVVDQTDHRENKHRDPPGITEYGFGQQLEDVLRRLLRDKESKHQLKKDPLLWVTGALKNPEPYLTMDVATLVADLKKQRFDFARRFIVVNVALTNPKLLDRIQCDAVQVISKDLWNSYTEEAIIAILQLEALAVHGSFDSQSIANEVEQVFLMEKPDLWRKGAESLKRLKKKFPQVTLANEARLHELIERDPAKYKKLLQPLLK